MSKKKKPNTTGDLKIDRTAEWLRRDPVTGRFIDVHTGRPARVGSSPSIHNSQIPASKNPRPPKK